VTHHVSEPTTRPGQLTPYAKRHPKQVTHPRRPLGISLSQEGVMSSLPGGVGLLVLPDQKRGQAPLLQVGCRERLRPVGLGES
jgi:hypothetical protein